MSNRVIELFTAGEMLCKACDVSEAQAAYKRFQKALDEDLTEEDWNDVHNYIRDMVHVDVFTNAVADYKAHPELYTERVTTLHNLHSVVKGKCTEGHYSKEDALSLKNILGHFSGLGACKTGDEVRAFVDDLSAHLEQHQEYRNAGYRRLCWEIESEIIGAYMEVFCRVERAPHDAYWLNLLIAMDELFVCAYPPNFLYYDMGIDFQVLTPENLLNETDPKVLRRKLKMVRAALGRWDVTACDAYVEDFVLEIAAAVLKEIQNMPEWKMASDATKLLAKYLADLLRDKLRGLTESVKEQEFENAEDNFICAQNELHKICTDANVKFLAYHWDKFLIYAASSPDVDALSVQAVLSLTVSLLALVEIDALPEALQCLIRFLLTVAASPVSFIYNDEVFRWILSGDAL